MKQLRYTILMVMATNLLFSCQNTMEVDAPNLNVALATQTCKVGEPVTFKFDGNADLIAFYPGDFGHNFIYRDNGQRLPIENMTLNFSTAVNLRKNTYKVTDHTLGIYISTDFNGSYDKESIQAASWTNLSSNFVFDQKSDKEVKSGDFDMEQYVQAEKPFYIAFKHTMNSVPSSSLASVGARIMSFYIGVQTSLGTVTAATLLATNVNAGFTLVDFGAGTNVAGVSTITSTEAKGQMLLQGPQQPSAGMAEIWAVSKSFDAAPIQMPNDVTIPIKGTSDAQPADYAYTYDKPGKYTAYFVAKNLTSDNVVEVIRTVEVIVTEN